jgi:hypothetical protein
LREEEGEKEALSQTVETILVTTRARRKRKATSKVKDAEVESIEKGQRQTLVVVEKCRHICGLIHRAMHQNTKAIKCEYHWQWWINLVQLDRLDLVKECLDISLH